MRKSKSSRSRSRSPKPTPSQIVDRYFESIGWKPFRFQRTTWRAYLNGHSGLIHSATGTGKTLAVWMGPILKWLKENPETSRWNPKRPPPVKVLWITPLRALAADTEQSLRDPIENLGIPWRLESRTGDTNPSAKARQLKRLPTALVTTPESLSLMLTHAKLLEPLAGVEAVIVDEWHELLGTKRGIQTELILARLRKLNPELRVWGVSATLGNLDQASQSLVGPESTGTRLIEGFTKKKNQLESVIPETMDRFPWTGHIGTRMIPQVAELLETVGSALVFANTRSQTEIWYQQLLKARPQWAGEIALHHGSLDNDTRRWVENGLRDGSLRAVVCTSSLDLGVDFSAVDLVVQIGSPKGSARLLQRAGRSGHQPDAASRLVFVPTNAIELAELAAAQSAIAKGHLEARPLLEQPIDVLTQHVVTIAIGGGFVADELLDEIRTTRAYRSMTETQWKWVLDFVVRGGSSLTAYPEFHRVREDEGVHRVTDQRTIRMHRMSIGTIVSEASMSVRYLKGATLGAVEESFVSKLNVGDKFQFAGRLLSLVMVQDNVAYVRKATGTPDTVPRWMGGRMPLSTELSQELRLKIEEAALGKWIGPEMKALRGLFEIQQNWSQIPHQDELLVEQIKTRGTHQTFVFPFEGRLAHEGMAALVAYRISQYEKVTFSMACNDYGFVLQSSQPVNLALAIQHGVFSAEGLVEDILSSLNATEMAKRQFRQVARVAGLVQSGYPGQRKSASHLQASSNLFYDVFSEYDEHNLLLHQSRQEVLDTQLEINRITSALERIAHSRIVLTTPPKVTPLAFPLLVDKLRERVSSESLADRIARLQQQLESAADQMSAGT